MMRLLRAVALVGLGAAMAALPAPVGAQPRSQDTYFTFSQPVELPNATLPAGSYLFQLVDSASDRHIVRVLSRDRQKLFTTVMAIPSYTLNSPPDEPQIRFMETPAGAPNVVKTWHYPGRTTGHEFIYPRSRATRLAQATGEPVLTTRSETDVSRDVDDNELTRVDRDGRDVDAAMDSQREAANARAQTGTMQADDAAPAAPATPSVAPAAPAAPAPERAAAAAQEPAPASRTAAPDRTRTALPSTASTLPVLGLLGLAALAGSALIRHARRS